MYYKFRLNICKFDYKMMYLWKLIYKGILFIGKGILGRLVFV